MFSIHLAESEVRQVRRAGLRERLLGKALGFAAGLTLIVAVNALFLHGRLLEGVSDGFASSHPSLSHVIKSVWATMVSR